MPHVYECNICGTITMSQGVTNHMKLSHGLSKHHYGVKDVNPYKRFEPSDLDLIILYENTKRGNTGRYWRKGYTVAKWLFEVDDHTGTRMLRGSRRHYILWISSRVRYLNRNKNHSLLEPSYMDDYIK